MRVITANLPISYIKTIKSLTTGEKRVFPSRSELIRVAIRDFLIKEVEGAENFIKFQSKFTKVYSPKIEKDEEEGTIKVPLATNSQGEVLEYKTYNVIQR